MYTAAPSIKVRRGFTLVELLVVTAIVAILVALTVPVMSRAKQKASAMGCAANLRQIGVALAQYGLDNGGSMPMLGQYSTNGTISYGMSDWYRCAIGYLLPPDKLAGAVHSSSYPYYDNERNVLDLGQKIKLFNCPTIDRKSLKAYFGPTQGPPWGLWINNNKPNVFNYGFNNIGGVAGTGINAATTKRLEQVVSNQIVVMDRDPLCNWSTTQSGNGQGTNANNCLPKGMGAFYWISWFSANYPSAGTSTAGTMHQSSMPRTGELTGGANILFSGLNVGICVPSRLYYPSWRGVEFTKTFTGTFTDKIVY